MNIGLHVRCKVRRLVTDWSQPHAGGNKEGPSHSGDLTLVWRTDAHNARHSSDPGRLCDPEDILDLLGPQFPPL